MSYWNSAWARFIGPTEQVQSVYREPERDGYGDLCCIDTMVSSQCFDFHRMVQSQIKDAFYERVTNLRISPDTSMHDALSNVKEDWIAATLLIIKVELMHLADRITPMHSHCSPMQYTQMQTNRANFETNNASAIHDKIHEVFKVLIFIIVDQHNRNEFEEKQRLAWQYFEFACDNHLYYCVPNDLRKIMRQLPHWYSVVTHPSYARPIP